MRGPWWKWSSAALALIITVAGAWWASRPPKPPSIVSIDVKVTGIVSKEAPYVKSEIPETLTPDPKTTSLPAVANGSR
jgi:hypothetical protein